MEFMWKEALSKGGKYVILKEYSYYMTESGEMVLHHLFYHNQMNKISLHIPIVFEYMDANALDDFKDELESITLANLKRIEAGTFYGYRKLSYIEGKHIEEIGKDAFYGTNLITVYFDKLQRIHSYAFTVLDYKGIYYLDLSSLKDCSFTKVWWIHYHDRFTDIKSVYTRKYQLYEPKNNRERHLVNWLGLAFVDITEDWLEV